MAVNTGKMPEKIIAAAKYHTMLLTEIHENPKNRITIIESALTIVGNYFGFYIDNLARRDHASFHHVYETGATGQERARLFFYSITKSGKSPSLNYQFKNATAVEKSGQVFRRKAFIMEDGNPLLIKPKNGKYLVFDLNGETVFAKQSYVPVPGGPNVAGSFERTFNEFINKRAAAVLDEMGFYDKINKEIKKESDESLSKISRGNLNSSSMASISATKIARKAK